MAYSILILLASFIPPLFHPPAHARACGRPRGSASAPSARISRVPYDHQQSCLCLLLLQQSRHTLVVLLLLFPAPRATAAAAPALAPSAFATPTNLPCLSTCSTLAGRARHFSYCPDLRESSLGSSIRCLQVHQAPFPTKTSSLLVPIQ